MRVAGIMSGTSLDGIDVAVVDVTAKSVKTIAHGTTPWARGVRERILEFSNAACTTAQISRLNFELAEQYAKAVRRLGSDLGIELVGCHGQTVYHEGGGKQPNTLQLGDAGVLAERLGIPVVSNFRTRDVAAGGQGAPLVPFVDYLLLRSRSKNRVALNIGGIANVTILPADSPPEGVIAFDTGPGNMVIDQLVRLHSSGKRGYDKGGVIAKSGTVDKMLLSRLLRGRYFRTAPPKSAGREQYGAEFVSTLVESGTALPHLIATATAFTAASIAAAVERFAPNTEELIAAGGGVHNRTFMEMLATHLPSVRLTTTAEFGIDPDAKEAVAFAILAWRTWHRKPGNLPSATGARHPVVLGSITH
ncbi:MAG: hypothetical protein JWN34_5544 [Bryobacterales bacterium]|nr:hypothetical protein [Bryobacterales bacterium]